MFTKRFSLFALAACALAAAGAALASPDIVAAVTALLSDPTAAGTGLMLAWGPAVRNLQAQHAAEVDGMTKIAALLGERDLTAEEQTAYDAHKAKATSLKSRISMAMEAESASAGLAPMEPAAAARGEGAVVIAAGARIQSAENTDADPQRGFRSLGDYLMSVRGAANAQRTGGAMDPRLTALYGGGPSAAAPSTYAGEGTGADGGFAVPVAYGTNIFQLSLEDQALLPLTDGLPVEGNGMSLPKDETTPWGTNGVRAYWQSEGTSGTLTKPVIGRSEYKLKKLFALVAMTEELLADATALGAYFEPAAARSIRWKTDEALLFGTGVGTPLGAFAGPSVVTVDKDSGQAAGTLSTTNVANMVSRLMPGSYGNAVWLINNDVLPALFTLTLGNYPIYLPAGSQMGALKGSPYGTLMGRPVLVSQHAKSFSSQGDLMLADMRMYQSITKAGGIQTATSMHLYFDADAVAFRATFRVDGQPKIAAPVTPANGSATLSPFVQLGAR